MEICPEFTLFLHSSSQRSSHASYSSLAPGLFRRDKSTILHSIIIAGSAECLGGTERKKRRVQSLVRGLAEIYINILRTLCSSTASVRVKIGKISYAERCKSRYLPLAEKGCCSVSRIPLFRAVLLAAGLIIRLLLWGC